MEIPYISLCILLNCQVPTKNEMTHTNFEGCLDTLRKQKVEASSKIRDCFYVKRTHSCPKQLYKNITGAGLHVEEQTKNIWNKTRIPLFSGSEKEVDLPRRSPCLSLLWSTNVIKNPSPSRTWVVSSAFRWFLDDPDVFLAKLFWDQKVSSRWLCCISSCIMTCLSTVHSISAEIVP